MAQLTAHFPKLLADTLHKKLNPTTPRTNKHVETLPSDEQLVLLEPRHNQRSNSTPPLASSV